MINLLFPSSVFSPKQVDEDLRTEYDAANNTGLYNIILFNYEQWFHHSKLVITSRNLISGNVIYRGWMMKPGLYESFFKELSSQGLSLFTSPDEYTLMHIFPNIYPSFGSDTAKMIIFPDGEKIDIEKVKKQISRFMIKDYVKSVKGTEFPKFFDETITQIEFDEWMKIFYKYRSDLYTGGICVKEYLPLKRLGTHTNEFRVFYAKNNVLSVCRNSGQGIYSEEPPAEMIKKYSSLGSPFYTVDYAQLEDGTWKVIEAGDGSVSGLSDGQDYEAFYRTLFYLTER